MAVPASHALRAFNPHPVVPAAVPAFAEVPMEDMEPLLMLQARPDEVSTSMSRAPVEASPWAKRWLRTGTMLGEPVPRVHSFASSEFRGVR